MKVLIVDDEPAAVARLAALIEDIDSQGTEIVGEANGGAAALELARDRRPDVILLDIAMREVDGFDVVRHLPEPRPLVIFQTAHHQFAVQAFEHEAIDYVVKPVSRTRLAAALERARARLAAAVSPPGWDAEMVERAGLAFGYTPVSPARLLVRHGAGHRLVPVAEIARFVAGDGVVTAHIGTGEAIVDYTVNELESRLGHAFARASRSDLINVSHIDKMTSDGDGSLTLILRDGAAVHVSRRRAADLKERLGR